MRHWFGQSLSDWTMDTDAPTTTDDVTTASVLATGPATITLWSAKTGGTQYTDLLDSAGAPITQVVSSAGVGGFTVGAIPEFQGPDGVFALWADAGGGARYKMIATDVGDVLTDLSATVATQQATIDLLSNSVGAVVYNTDTSSWPARPDDSRVYVWFGPTAPALIPPGDYWINPTPGG